MRYPIHAVDREAIRGRLVAVEHACKAIKLAVRRVTEGAEVVCSHCKHISRKTVVLKKGRDMTSQEGQELRRSRDEATVLCTLLAMCRGKMHPSWVLLTPKGLALLAVALENYRAVVKPDVTVPEYNQLLDDTTEAEKQPVQVFNVDSQGE